MHLKLILTLALACCISITAHTQSSSKYLKTIQQEGYTLYFIKPIKFKAGKHRLIPDFTFQHSEGAPEEVSVKFSLFSKTPFREMSHLSFDAGEKELGRSSGSELMFLEKNKGKWHARFSTSLPYSTLMAMLDAGETLELRFHGQEAVLQFPANRKWDEASTVIREILWAEVGK